MFEEDLFTEGSELVGILLSKRICFNEGPAFEAIDGRTSLITHCTLLIAARFVDQPSGLSFASSPVDCGRYTVVFSAPELHWIRRQLLPDLRQISHGWPGVGSPFSVYVVRCSWEPRPHAMVLWSTTVGGWLKERGFAQFLPNLPVNRSNRSCVAWAHRRDRFDHSAVLGQSIAGRSLSFNERSPLDTRWCLILFRELLKNHKANHVLGATNNSVPPFRSWDSQNGTEKPFSHDSVGHGNLTHRRAVACRDGSLGKAELGWDCHIRPCRRRLTDKAPATAARLLVPGVLILLRCQNP